MTRRLVAAYACRLGGTRLYGKPLQNLAPGIRILDHIIAAAKTAPEIDQIVLGIAEGTDNRIFAEIAESSAIGHIFGSEKDVLMRLIQCGREGEGTDVFRVTSECPFTAWELLPQAWKRHVENENDITVTDFLPEGCNFEIYRLDALERSHREGRDAERSEYCSAYARRCHDQFRIEVIRPPEALERLDLRLTVDNPEDLMVCRDVYAALKERGPHIPMADIVSFLDGRPDLIELVRPFVVPEPLWAHVCEKQP